jgi:hypothetical protein
MREVVVWSLANPHRYALTRHERFGLPDGVLAVMENTCSQDRAGSPLRDTIRKMLQITYAARGNDWDRNGIRNLARQFEIKT